MALRLLRNRESYLLLFLVSVIKCVVESVLVIVLLRLERATLTDLWKPEEDLWIVQQVVQR